MLLFEARYSSSKSRQGPSRASLLCFGVSIRIDLALSHCFLRAASTAFFLASRLYSRRPCYFGRWSAYSSSSSPLLSTAIAPLGLRCLRHYVSLAIPRAHYIAPQFALGQEAPPPSLYLFVPNVAYSLLGGAPSCRAPLSTVPYLQRATILLDLRRDLCSSCSCLSQPRGESYRPRVPLLGGAPSCRTPCSTVPYLLRAIILLDLRRDLWSVCSCLSQPRGECSRPRVLGGAQYGLYCFWGWSSLDRRQPQLLPRRVPCKRARFVAYFVCSLNEPSTFR